MACSDTEIQEFKTIFLKETGTLLSDEEARKRAEDFYSFFELIMKD